MPCNTMQHKQTEFSIFSFVIFRRLVSIYHRSKRMNEVEEKTVKRCSCLIPLFLIRSIYFEVNSIFSRFSYFWPFFWNTIQNKNNLSDDFGSWLDLAWLVHFIVFILPTDSDFDLFSLSCGLYIYTQSHIQILYTRFCVIKCF